MGTVWLEKLIDDYGNDVLRYAYLYLGDHGLAEDASQQVFLKAYQGFGRFRGEASARTWILRITINTCKNIRKSRMYRSRMEDCSLDALQVHPAAPHNTEQQEIWQEVLSLPDKFRDVVLLKYYYGFDTAKIAELLEVSPAAARTRLSRALAHMRIQVEGRAQVHEREDLEDRSEGCR